MVVDVVVASVGVQRNLCIHISRICRIFLVTAMNFMGGVDGQPDDDPEVCKEWCDRRR